MDDSNNQDNKKTNSSLVLVHSLFSVSVRSLINDTVSITEELRQRGASVWRPELGPSMEMNEDQTGAFNIELGSR